MEYGQPYYKVIKYSNTIKQTDETMFFEQSMKLSPCLSVCQSFCQSMPYLKDNQTDNYLCTHQ